MKENRLLITSYSGRLAQFIYFYSQWSIGQLNFVYLWMKHYD